MFGPKTSSPVSQRNEPNHRTSSDDLLDRPPPWRCQMIPEHYLCRYDSLRQAWGDLLSEVPWAVFGCGTFRVPASEDRAVATVKLMIRELGRQRRTRLYYFYVVERRPSGSDLEPIGRHVHFLLDGPPQYRAELVTLSQQFWNRRSGNCRAAAYDPSLDGASYVSKLLEFPNTAYDFRLPEVRNPIPSSTRNRRAAYIPHHARGIERLETLTLRNCRTKLPLSRKEAPRV